MELIESNKKITLSDEECMEYMKSKHIKCGANLFIVENMEKLAAEYENDNLYDQALYFYRLLYSIKKDEETFKKIKSLDMKTRRVKRKI